MKELIDEYQKTANMLYSRIKTLNKGSIRYKLLLSEYQDVCFVKRNIKSYCKILGLLK